MTKSIADLFAVYKNGLSSEIKEEKEEYTPLFNDRYSNYRDLLNVLGSRKIDTSESEEQTSEGESNEEVFEETSPKVSSKMDRLRDYSSNKNPVKTIMDFFISKGFSEEAAAGFVGNFMAESNLNPEAYNKEEKAKGLAYGRGLPQWSNERAKQAEKFLGKPIIQASLNEQLEYIYHELQSRPELLRRLKTANIYDSTDFVYRGYENGSSNALTSKEKMQETYSKSWRKLGLREYNFNQELQHRQNQAIKALNIYQS